MFLGADGAGKSTLIRAVVATLTAKGRSVALFHFRPSVRSRPPVTRPYLKDPHPLPVSLAKVLWWLTEYNTWALWVSLRPKAPEIVLFDRGIVDVMFDPRRYRLPELFRRLNVMLFLVVRPSVVFLLNTTAGELQRRKPEVTSEEADRQCAAYARRPNWSTRVVSLDGGQPPDALARQALDILMPG